MLLLLVKLIGWVCTWTEMYPSWEEWFAWYVCFDGTLGIRALWLFGSIMCYVVNVAYNFKRMAVCSNWN
jgi:hypothetical protein